MRDPAQRYGIIRLSAAAFGFLAWSAAAGAQSTTLGAGSHAAPSRAPSVIVPHPGIDPGMRVKPPRQPTGTQGIIRPRTAPTPGSNTVVVPR